MNDPYEKAWESIGKALSTQSKMVLWIAERTLSAKDFKEFVDEFAKKPEDNHDELLDFIRNEGR
jgi:F0F1-type ATP synthase delta subunit